MSKSYLSWAQRNFEKNKLNPKHYEFIRANILEWICKNPTPEFDLIVLDPPTFSNTKSSDQTLDIQRDHVNLIQQAAAWLAPGGVLYFSNNAHGFKLDQTALDQFEIQDLTRASIDTDFDRSPPHVLFKLSSKVPE
jgi:Predicted SAM-dependent methyltransferases